MLMRVHSGRASGVICSQFLPASLEMWTSPSSEPAQNTPFSWGDSTKAENRAVRLSAGAFLGEGTAGEFHFCNVIAS